MEKINYEEEIIKRDNIIKELKKEIELLKLEVNKYKTEAYYDSLTHLNNRRILENAADYDSVIIGDIDYFKKINDTYGHLKGDEVLIAISEVLQAHVRSTDIVCRWGGEEFVLLLNNTDVASSLDKVTLIKDSIESLEKAFDFKITMSFGLTEIDKDKSIDEIINEADEAMYQSKLNGKNMISVYKSKVK